MGTGKGTRKLRLAKAWWWCGSSTLCALGACSSEPPRVMVPMQLGDALTPRETRGIDARDGGLGRVANASLLGRWEGTRVQGDGTSWPMVVDISSLKGAACATVVYPTVPCSGSWTCVSDSDGRTLSALERIAEGRSECTDGASMRLFLTPEGALDWNWSGGRETAHARLRRERH